MSSQDTQTQNITTAQKTIRLIIKRQDGPDAKPYTEEFEIPTDHA